MTTEMNVPTENVALTYFPELTLKFGTDSFSYYLTDETLTRNVEELANYFNLLVQDCREMLSNMFCAIGISDGSRYYGFSETRKGEAALKKIQTTRIVEMYRIPPAEIRVKKYVKGIYAFLSMDNEKWSLTIDRRSQSSVCGLAKKLSVDELDLVEFLLSYGANKEGVFADKESCVHALENLAHFVEKVPKRKKLYALPYTQFGEHYTISHLNHTPEQDEDVIHFLQVDLEWYIQKVKEAGGTLVNGKVIFIQEVHAQNCIQSIFSEITI